MFGGADVGLMGELARSALASGGRVTGVIPKSICDKVGFRGLTALHVVETMHERKQKMFELSDAFIGLPGGMGTLDEVFEVLTWAQLGLHSKPCGLLNTGGYFDGLLRFLDHSVVQRFLKQEHRAILLDDEAPASLLSKLRAYKPPRVEKWLDRK